MRTSDGKRKKLSPDEVSAACRKQIDASIGYLGDAISQDRAEFWRMYRGLPGADVQAELSDYVSHDASDVIDHIVPELMRMFLASGRVVEFTPGGQQDEDQAKLESAVMNSALFEMSSAYLMLHNWMMDGLITKNGIVKSWWEESEETRVEHYDGISEDVITATLVELEDQGHAAKVVRKIEVREGLEDEGGNVVDVRISFDVTIEITETISRWRVEAIPPDEFIIAPRWNDLELQECAFTGHSKPDVYVGDLIEDGYDPDVVNGLLREDGLTESEERIERFRGDQSDESGEYNAPPGMDRVRVTECYIRMDYFGTGRPVLLKVTIGGSGGSGGKGQKESPNSDIMRWAPHMKDRVDSIAWPFDIEIVEDVPFFAWSPYMVPHKFFGQSVVEKMADIQDVNTVISRQMLNNMTHVNNPRPGVDASRAHDDTFNDLSEVVPGAPYRTNGHPGEVVAWQTVPPMIEPNLATLEHFKMRLAQRTGVTAVNEGIDPDTLNQRSGRAIDLHQQAGRGKIEFYGRNFAEGLKRLILHGHKLYRRFAPESMDFRVNGQWTEVQPRRWLPRNQVSVLVGLGTGAVDSKLMMYDRLMERQMQLLPLGMVQPDHIRNTMERVVDLMQLGEIENYMSSQEEMEAKAAEQAGQPQQEDPMLQAAREAEGIKAQGHLLGKQIDMQTDMAKLQMEDDRKRDEAKLDVLKELIKAGISFDQAVAQAAMSAKQADAQPNGATNGSQ